jgi:hypothetical protein
MLRDLSKLKSLHVNQFLAILYLTLGVIAIAIPKVNSGVEPKNLWIKYDVIITFALLLVANLPNICKLFLSKHYETMWEKVRRMEAK